MNTFAAVMTGKATGAISTIQLFGENAEAVIKKIFRPVGKKTLILKPGLILVGTIYDDDKAIDQVTIGCEDTDNFAIHCHGNPLIVEIIMKMLGRGGVKLITAEDILTKTLVAKNTIELEAKLAGEKAKTLFGTKIIANQIDSGLSVTAQQWLKDIDKIPLKKITGHATQILKDTKTAKLIIDGCKVVLAGPPNSGKSTLLNCLCGRDKAIVTDIKGTTRDWVGATCQVGPLSVELIDTAGLDEKSADQTDLLEKKSQQKTREVLERADLILLVLDASEPIEQLNSELLELIADKKIVTILNKSDIKARLNVEKLPKTLANQVKISAMLNTGIENLKDEILQICDVVDFPLQKDVCTTARQEKLLRDLTTANSTKNAISIITELLNGKICV